MTTGQRFGWLSIVCAALGCAAILFTANGPSNFFLLPCIIWLFGLIIGLAGLGSNTGKKLGAYGSIANVLAFVAYFGLSVVMFAH